MKNIIEKMFDFDMEVGELEKEFFSVKEKIEPIFNFIDLSFQCFFDPIDDNVATLFKKMNELLIELIFSDWPHSAWRII